MTYEPWASFITPLGLSDLICKMGMMVIVCVIQVKFLEQYLAGSKSYITVSCYYYINIIVIIITLYKDESDKRPAFKDSLK